jgi:hypothetical protein
MNVSEVTPKMTRHFGDVFGLEMTSGSREELLAKLEMAEQIVAVPV